MMMDDIFPKSKLRTYSKRRRGGVKKETLYMQHKSDLNIKDKPKVNKEQRNKKKNTADRKHNDEGSRQKNPTLKSDKLKKPRRTARKKSARSPKQWNLSLGLFASVSEDKDEEGDCTPKSVMVQNIVEDTKGTKAGSPKDKGHDTLPSEVMESDDKINAWLSSQDQQDNTDSSIEIMREDITTVAEKKSKLFPAEFYTNLEKVLHKVDDPVQTEHKSKHSSVRGRQHSTRDSFTGGQIASLSSPVFDFTSTTGLGSIVQPRTDPASRTTCYSASTNARSTTFPTSTQPVSYTTGEMISTENEKYTGEIDLSPVPYADLYDNRAPGMLIDVSLTESLKEKEKSEKTPGKRTSFAVPGSPVKSHKDIQRKKNLNSALKTSTRLFQTDTHIHTPEAFFQTNDTAAEAISRMSSIQCTSDQKARFVNSEVSSSIGPTKSASKSPKIQETHKAQFPRLTSTPNRKTSTPNKDGFHLSQFEIDLSSVSVVNSDEEGLQLHESARDIISDEHLELSKTRIEEPVDVYVCQPAVDKIVIAGGNTEPVSFTKQPTKKCTEKSLNNKVPAQSSLKRNTNVPMLSRKKTHVGNLKENLSEREDIVSIHASHENDAEPDDYIAKNQQAKQTETDSVFEHDVRKTTIRSFQPESVLQNLRNRFSSNFSLKEDGRLQSITSDGPKIKAKPSITEICTLMNCEFTCPKRNSFFWQYHRNISESYNDRIAKLPVDDLL